MADHHFLTSGRLARVYTPDGVDLVSLATKHRVTVAQLYRDLFATTVRCLLIADMQRELRELEGNPE